MLEVPAHSLPEAGITLCVGKPPSSRSSDNWWQEGLFETKGIPPLSRVPFSRECGMVRRESFGYTGATVTLHEKRKGMSVHPFRCSPFAFSPLKIPVQPSDGDEPSFADPPCKSQKYFLTHALKSAWAGVPLSLLSQPCGCGPLFARVGC